MYFHIIKAKAYGLFKTYGFDLGLLIINFFHLISLVIYNLFVWDHIILFWDYVKYRIFKFSF